MDRFGYKRTCNIRSTSGESLDSSVFHTTIESRNNCLFAFLKTFCKKFVCLVCIKVSVLVKTDHSCGIYEFISKICSHHFTIQKLSSGCCVLCTCLCFEISFDLTELFLEGKFKLQTLDDLIKTFFDLVEDTCKVSTCCGLVIACIQKICYLGVSRVSLTRCRRNHITSALLASDDIPYFFELFCVRKGASSKFHNFFHNNSHPSVFL